MSDNSPKNQLTQVVTKSPKLFDQLTQIFGQLPHVFVQLSQVLKHIKLLSITFFLQRYAFWFIIIIFPSYCAAINAFEGSIECKSPFENIHFDPHVISAVKIFNLLFVKLYIKTQ